MALGGSGTSSDPYIVHDWAELLEAFNGISGHYIELANDIEAPAEPVTVQAKKTQSLDGKGYSIKNIHHTSNDAAISFGASSGNISGNKYLKNIKFTNLYITNGYCVWVRSTNGNGYINDVSFWGRVDGGTLIWASNTSPYGPYAYINRIAANIETGNGNFYFLKNYFDTNGTISNGNVKVKYINCSPQNALTTWSWSNTLFDIIAENTATKVNLGNSLSNCCVIGKGSGVTFTSGSGSNVVESTLPLPDPAPSHTYSLSTADIKNAQKLHDDYGFPIGVD